MKSISSKLSNSIFQKPPTHLFISFHNHFNLFCWVILQKRDSLASTHQCPAKSHSNQARFIRCHFAKLHNPRMFAEFRFSKETAPFPDLTARRLFFLHTASFQDFSPKFILLEKLIQKPTPAQTEEVVDF